MRNSVFTKMVVFILIATFAPFGVSSDYEEKVLDQGKEDLRAIKTNSENNGVEFGVSSGSIFDIDPSSSIGINVNFTSQMESQSRILLIVDWPNQWEVSWDNESSPNIGREYNVSPGQLIWAQFTVSSPPVIGGFPLSQSLHVFSMSIVAMDGHVLDWYNFSLRYGNYDGAEIIQGGGSSSISPGETLTLETVARNTGNSIRDLEVEILAIGEDGSEISEPGLFFSTGNWSASVIEKWRIENLAPNATGSILVQVFSPSLVGEKLNFEIRVRSSGPSTGFSSVSHLVNIISREGGDISIIEDECTSSNTIPGDVCEVGVVLTNTGDAQESFLISISESPEWIDLQLETNVIQLQKGDSSDTIKIICRVKENTPYNLTSQITIRLFIGDWSPSMVSFEVKSGALFSWSSEQTEEIVESGNLTVSWVMTNNGNSVDGLTASIDSSIVTAFGISLLPSDSEIIVFNSTRALEIYPIRPGQSVEVQGWMEIPASSPSEVMAELTVEIRSVMSPDIFITEGISILIPGEGPTEPDTEDEELMESLIHFLNRWLEPMLIVSVTLFGIFGTILALRRNGPEAPPSEPAEKQGDWMSKFSRGEVNEIYVEGGDKARTFEFGEAFFGQEGVPSANIRNEISVEEINDANKLLDESKEKSDIEDVLRIAEELETQDILHPDNLLLDSEDYHPNSEEYNSQNQGPPDFDLEL